jgi:hypothetical protein
MTTITYSVLAFILVALIYFAIMGTGIVITNLLKHSRLWKTLW